MVQRTAVTGRPLVMVIRGRGQMTLPAELRREMGIKEGDVFTVVPLNDSLLITRKRLVVSELIDKIVQIMEEEGITLDDLLAGLEEQRARYNRERYGLEA